MEERISLQRWWPHGLACRMVIYLTRIIHMKKDKNRTHGCVHYLTWPLWWGIVPSWTHPSTSDSKLASSPILSFHKNANFPLFLPLSHLSSFLSPWREFPLSWWSLSAPIRSCKETTWLQLPPIAPPREVHLVPSQFAVSPEAKPSQHWPNVGPWLSFLAYITLPSLSIPGILAVIHQW